MQYLRFNAMNFNVLNVAHFHQNVDRLIEYLKTYEPTFVIIDWCFATNGDLVLALRARGFFSKVFLEFDLRNIFKCQSAMLSNVQVDVLKKAQNEEYKHFILSGGSGSGKTVLGVEIVKIKIAKLIENLKQVDLKVYVHVCVNDQREPTELLKRFHSDSFIGMEAYLTDKSFSELER